jgi:hypothetical protein
LTAIGSPKPTQVLPSNLTSCMVWNGAKSSGWCGQHARQRHRDLEVLEAGRLLHHVLAREVVAALLEHLHVSCARAMP